MLARAALPTRDLTPASIENFLVAAVANQLVGAVAVERHGDVGLLRSLVVASTRRNDGIGSVLVDALERRAHNEGLISLVLLTETAGIFSADRLRRGAAQRGTQGGPAKQRICVCLSRQRNVHGQGAAMTTRSI